MSVLSKIRQRSLELLIDAASADRTLDAAEARRQAARELAQTERQRPLVHLRELLERRFDLLGKLGRLEVANPAFVGSLTGKAAPTRAACYVGLQRFVALETAALAVGVHWPTQIPFL
jgi:acyl-CoA reductase-like NAD-dependent aldehyde dehydrogenase